MLLDLRSLVFATTLGLQLVGYAPTAVQAEGVASPDTTITPSADTVLIAGEASVIGIGLIPDTGALALTGHSATLGFGVLPPVGDLAQTGQTPGLAFGMPGEVGTLTLTGQASSLAFGLVGDVGTLILSGHIPALLISNISSDTLQTPVAGALLLTGKVPTVAQSGSAATRLRQRVIRGQDTAGRDDWWISYQA